jgi:hypothetical protein
MPRRERVSPRSPLSAAISAISRASQPPRAGSSLTTFSASDKAPAMPPSRARARALLARTSSARRVLSGSGPSSARVKARSAPSNPPASSMLRPRRSHAPASRDRARSQGPLQEGPHLRPVPPSCLRLRQEQGDVRAPPLPPIRKAGPQEASGVPVAPPGHLRTDVIQLLAGRGGRRMTLVGGENPSSQGKSWGWTPRRQARSQLPQLHRGRHGRPGRPKGEGPPQP